MSALVACADEDEEDESAKTLEEGSKRQTVPKFCVTRWSAKITTLSALLAKYGSVLLALDEILSSSSGDAKRNASAYSRLLQDSEFIVALTVSQFVLSFLAQVTKPLQAKSCNLGDAYQSVTLSKEFKSARGDKSWQKVWSRISQVADSINATLIKPRIKTVQRHRANNAHNDQPSDYYRINVFYPFIYHVVGELETRFSVQHEGLITAQNLFPLYLPKLTDRHIEKIKNYFSKHLDFSEKSNFDAELARRRKKHAMEPESEQEGAMPDCSPQEFPAIHKVLSIFLTTPVLTLLLSPTPSNVMDSVINDRKSIKWPCYAVNSSRNGFHSHSKRDLRHDVKLEKNLEQPNIDSFLRLGILIPKPEILAQFLQANLCSN